MSLASFILPNLNLDALLGVLIAIVGAGFIYLSKFVLVKDLKKFTVKIGMLMIFGGLGYWVIISWFQDILADPKIWMSSIAALIVIASGIIIFWEK